MSEHNDDDKIGLNIFRKPTGTERVIIYILHKRASCFQFARQNFGIPPYPTFKARLSLGDSHGFRKRKSTTTAFIELTQYISNGMSRSKNCYRTIIAALDLTKTFDTVSHSVLLSRGIVRTQDKNGRIAGGTLSPIFLNFYMSILSNPPPGDKLR